MRVGRRPNRTLMLLTVALALTTALGAQTITLPNQKNSVHFAVIGDTGSGSAQQYRIGERLAAARAVFPYDIVLMLGDNIYGGSDARDFADKFEKPYKSLLDGSVKFYASLGNHDNTNERLYKPFNMNGERYYTFKPSNGSVRFFALDSNYMDRAQLAWLDKELANSGSDWKICYFHHPIYSSGKTHGSDLRLRTQLEPLFIKYGVNVVLAGHDHFYERIKPQHGIQYFVSGAGGQLRPGDVRRSDLTEKAFDTGYHFILFEIADDTLFFQAISDQGQTVDSGAITRLKQT